MAQKTAHIIGGGLVGTLAAIELAQCGIPVVVHEHRPDIRDAQHSQDADAKRTINLSLTSRGLKALEGVGLKEEAIALSVVKDKRIIHGTDGSQTEIRYGHKPNEILYSIARNDLNTLLINKAESLGVTFDFDSHCSGYDPNEKTLTFTHAGAADEQVDKILNVKDDIVIGADGAGRESVIRDSLAKKVPGFEISRRVMEYGYKELVIPSNAPGAEALDNHAIHMWPRGQCMLIAMPKKSRDGFRVSLFLPLEGEDSFETLNNDTKVRDFFEKNFPHAIPLMPSLIEDFRNHPVGNMITVQCNHWHHGDALLIGDAAHAIVPFFAQGMNAGFEDCHELGERVRQEQRRNETVNWERVFSALEKSRKPNIEAIANISLNHCEVLLNKGLDPRVRFKEEVEFELAHRFPDKFITRYAMIAFHPEIPYAEAGVRCQLQDMFLDDLCKNATTLADIDWKKAESWINRQAKKAGGGLSRGGKITKRALLQDRWADNF